QEENLPHHANNPWMLCQELRPRMQSEALMLKMQMVFSLISDADYEILRSCLSKNHYLSLAQVLDKDQSLNNGAKVNQMKEVISIVSWMTQMDPDLLKKMLHECASIPQLLWLAWALSEIDAKGIHYDKWCKKLTGELNLANLSLAELDRCLTNWKYFK